MTKARSQKVESEESDERAIYEQHLGFFELALTHFDIPYDAATIGHRAALQDHAYMAERMLKAKQAQKEHQRAANWARQKERIGGMFALPASWLGRLLQDAVEAPPLAETADTVRTASMFAIPRYLMVPDDGSYPPDLGATRMLDMMVEAGLVVREEPKVVAPTTDGETRFRRPPAVRYWGLAQAAASAARHQRAHERAAERR